MSIHLKFGWSGLVLFLALGSLKDYNALEYRGEAPTFLIFVRVAYILDTITHKGTFP